ncbi:MAG: LysM peptidoglycan-binding domain-containing protein [Anaerolineae bacterium]
MADKKDKKGKGLLGKMIDAVTDRDEKEAAAEAEAKRRADALEEETRRKIAEKRAREAEEKAKEAAAKLKEMEAEKARMEAEKKAAAEKARQEEARAKVREFEAKREAEMAAKKAELEAKAAEEAAKLVYVVKSGDSLSKIAKEQLGDANRWPEIHELNKDQIPNPNLIRVGQELKLPK